MQMLDVLLAVVSACAVAAGYALFVIVRMIIEGARHRDRPAMRPRDMHR